MIDSYAQAIADPFRLIEEMYNKPLLSNDESKQLETALAKMNLTAKGTMAVGIGGIAITFAVSRLPYIGTGIGVLTGIAGCALAIFGYDMQKSAHNLQEFSQDRLKNMLAINIKGNSKEETRKIIFDKATQGTIIIRTIYETAIVNKQH